MAAKKTVANPTSASAPPKEGARVSKPHELMLMSTAQNASAMEKFGCFGEVDVVSLIEALGDKVQKIQEGNMKPVEAMLYGQAQALQAIFTNMARRSALNAGEYINASETYMKLALKAQSQCRATLETLAIVKNPMPYIRQANIANGPQQVNNAGTQSSGTQAVRSKGTQNSTQQNKHAHAEKTETEQNKLLEADHGNYLDTRTQGAAGRANQTVAAVG